MGAPTRGRAAPGHTCVPVTNARLSLQQRILQPHPPTLVAPTGWDQHAPQAHPCLSPFLAQLQPAEPTAPQSHPLAQGTALTPSQTGARTSVCHPWVSATAPLRREGAHLSPLGLLLISTTFQRIIIIIVIIIVLKTVFTTSSRSEVHTKQTLSTTESRTGSTSRGYLLRSHQRGTQTCDSFNPFLHTNILLKLLLKLGLFSFFFKHFFFLFLISCHYMDEVMLALQRCVSKTAATINGSLATAKKVNPRFLSSSLSAPSALQYPSTRVGPSCRSRVAPEMPYGRGGVAPGSSGTCGEISKELRVRPPAVLPFGFLGGFSFLFFFGRNHLFGVCN